MKYHLSLYDTLSREKKQVTAMDGKTLGYYCCGPTVYAAAHIGNFRTFVVQDFFRRVVELAGFKTKHVRNFTDVDDKTIRDSQAAGQSLDAFTQHWKNLFHQDCAELNLLDPHIEPSAVAHIKDQIEMIAALIEKGLAYQADDGSVYYRVSAFPEYGRLSRLKDREITSTNESTALADEYERDSLVDFALWKSRKQEDGENSWESPWGEGRPGWHIECSAMSRCYLGDSFDVHSGGVDLIFPHHENEIAQSEGATGKPFSALWFHVTHLLVDGHKMSKSDGNLYTLGQLEEMGFDGGDLRYVLLMGHYRKPLNFTLDSLEIAKRARARIGTLISRLQEKAQFNELPDYDQLLKKGADFYLQDNFKPVWNSLLDDLNSPEALGHLFTAIKPLEAHIPNDSETAKQQLLSLSFVLQALGIKEIAPRSIEVPEEIRTLAEKRLKARKEKNWSQADALRDEITEAGWSIKDAGESYELTPL